MPSNSESSLQNIAAAVTNVLENSGARVSAEARAVRDIEKYTTAGNSGVFVFPSHMRNDSAGYPHMSFRTGSSYIYFPIPAGLTFSDQAEYSSVDLGLLGIEIDKGMGPTAGQGAGKAVGVTAGIGASILAKAKGYQKTSDALTLGTGRLMSPNKRTSFQGMSIRTFEFAFKMMAKNESDAKMIRDINTIFRLNIYPSTELGGAILNFPPTWSIKFYNNQGRENTHIPRIYDECFLTAVNSTYNAGSNLFHSDGSPVEVDISLRFEEAKALTRDDLYKLADYSS
jgi:hypothetical protein